MAGIQVQEFPRRLAEMMGKTIKTNPRIAKTYTGSVIQTDPRAIIDDLIAKFDVDDGPDFPACIPPRHSTSISLSNDPHRHQSLL